MVALVRALAPLGQELHSRLIDALAAVKRYGTVNEVRAPKTK